MSQSLYNRYITVPIYTTETQSTYVGAFIEAVQKGIDLTDLVAHHFSISHPIPNFDIGTVDGSSLLFDSFKKINGKLDLRNAKLTGVDFREAYFINCIFDGTDFKNTSNFATVFDTYSFSNCSLRNCDFTENLFIQEQEFELCDLSESLFSNAKYRVGAGTVLSNANKLVMKFVSCSATDTDFSTLVGYTSAAPQMGVLFSNCDLKNSSFGSLNFSLNQTYFYNCDLSRADFSRTNISNARQYFGSTQVFQSKCILDYANFTKAILSNEDLSECSLNNTQFVDADLTRIEITENLSATNCNFNGAIILSANFGKSDLSNSYFVNQTFDGISFFNSILKNCNFKNSNFVNIKDMDYCNFEGSNFTGAIFGIKNFSSLILKGCNFKDVDLRNIIFSSEISRAQEAAEYELSLAEQNLAQSQAISAEYYSSLNTEIIQYNMAKVALDAASIPYANTSAAYLSAYGPYIAASEKVIALRNTRDTAVRNYLSTYGKDWLGHWGEATIWRGRYHDEWIKAEYDLKMATIVLYFAKQHYDAIAPTYLPAEEAYRQAKQVFDAIARDLIPKLVPYFASIEQAEKDYKSYLIAEEKYQEIVSAGDPPEFLYTSFDGANLTNTNLSGTDLSYISFIDAILTNTLIVNCNFTSATMPDANLSNQNLSGCNFYRAVLSGSNFSYIQYMAHNFIQADLTQAQFLSANCMDCNFTSATMIDVSFSKNVIVSGTNAPIFNYANLSNATLNGLDFNGNKNIMYVNLSGANLDKCNLLDTDFKGSNFDNASLIGITAIGASFSGCSMQKTDFSKAIFSSAKFTGSKITKAFFQYALADYCDFTYCNLSGSDMRYAIFDQSNFKYSYMQYSDLRESSWQANNFSYADLSHVKAFKINFKFPILKGTTLQFLELQKLNLGRVS